MTFLIEPGIALSQPSTKPERAGSNPPGSGEVFARSLEEDRGKAKNEGETQTPANGKATVGEETASQLTLLRNGHGEADLEADLTSSSEGALLSGDEIADTSVLESTEITAVRGEHTKHTERTETEVSEATEDNDEIPLATAATAPLEMTEMSVAVDTVSEDGPGIHVVADARQNTDTSPKAPLPASSVQAMTVQATIQSENGQTGRTSGKDTRVTGPVTVNAASAAISDAANQDVQPAAIPLQGENTGRLSGKADPVEQNDGFLAKLVDADREGISVTGKPGTLAHASPAADHGSQIIASAMGASPVSPQAAQPAPSPIQMTPTHAVITASPAETVKIITDTVSAPDSAPDKITVQLDPPELGRVSIDFKFDAHGLQHITVTGESPEALRQLRLMHFELTQALERSGMSGQSMTFQQQQSGQHQTQTPASGRLFDDNGLAAETSLLTTANISADSIRPARTASGGIDIRL